MTPRLDLSQDWKPNESTSERSALDHREPQGFLPQKALISIRAERQIRIILIFGCGHGRRDFRYTRGPRPG